MFVGMNMHYHRHGFYFELNLRVLECTVVRGVLSDHIGNYDISIHEASFKACQPNIALRGIVGGRLPKGENMETGC
jgi:hypothetical protein